MGVFNNFPYANFHELNADWIVEQVRNVMNEWEEYRTDMDQWKLGVDDQLAEFQTWFDNLDVQDEVRTVINELIQSGEFIEITSPQIVSATEAWLAAHITPTTPAVDDTLSISGAAADAKVTGDRTTDLKEDLNTSRNAIDDIVGFYTPSFEIGAIAFSSASIAYQNVNTAIRTPSNESIMINKGDKLCLTDYTNAKFKYAIYKSDTETYVYTDYVTTDQVAPVSGRLYIVIQTLNADIQTSVFPLENLFRIKRVDGAFENINKEFEQTAYDLTELSLHQIITEKRNLSHAIFEPGEISGGVFSPTRLYRCSTPQKWKLPYNISINAESGYKFYVIIYDSFDDDEDRESYGWITSYNIHENSIFRLMFAKVTEDESVTADPAEFVTHYVVSTDFTNLLPKEVEVNTSAISEYMAHFYLSDTSKSEEYAFFTDPHLMGTNGTFSEELFKKYIDNFEATVKRTSAFYVVCGGDWLNNGDTKEQASVKLGYVDGQMRSRFPGSYYPIVGNHDFNYLGVDANGNRLTEANWIGNHDMPSFWFQHYGECYYKFKVGIAQNYVLNTRTDYDGTGQYDEEMLDWLADSLIHDDPEHATLLFHIYRLVGEASTIPTRVLAIGEIISAFNSHSICTLTEATHEYDKTYDFTNTTGHIDYSMVGHSHADFIQTLGGVPIIATRNMRSGDIPTYDLVFADYTHGKLYLTRVGSGESRSVNI